MIKNIISASISFLFILVFTLSSRQSIAQNLESATINTSGNTFSQEDISFEWSVGELALVETMTNSSGILTNGLLQPVSPAHIITTGFMVSPNNILSPNGDGKNDLWVIKDIEKYPDNEVTIFDRAGRIVYNTTDYKNTWQGTLANAPLAQDTYYYIIKLIKDGKVGIIKGFITILN